MIIIGILLVSVSSMSLAGSIPIDIKLPVWLNNIFINLGTGLIAAGLLTVTLEKSNRKRHHEDIEELKRFHGESILKELIPQPFFDEVKVSIMDHPFLRSNYQGTIQMNWKDVENKKYLIVTDVYSYDIKNISNKTQEFEVRIYEDKMHEDIFPGCTKVVEFKIERILDEDKEIEITKILPSQINKETNFIEAKIPIELKPNQKITVSQHLEYVRLARDTYSYVLSKPTLDLLVTIMHPDDIILDHVLMHSSTDSLVINTNTTTLKVFQIRAGILPYQGILFTWGPKAI